jgi:two-component system chemotaxis response regulator CheB
MAFFSALPVDLDATILVVLHVPPYTPSQLDQVLRGVTTLPVVIAKDGEPLEQGRIYVATADHHLMVSQQGIRVTRGPKEGRARPSVDVLFRSAAVAFGARVIGVVLSGTLDDGTAGLWAIKDQQGAACVQDPAEAMHASMPESAIEHVEVDFVGTAAGIFSHIAQLVGQELPMNNSTSVSARHGIENLIALEGNGLQAGVMTLGQVSKYTCPECHGVLVEIEEGRIVRFRCHTGHAFSLKTLITEINEAMERGLWDTLRAGEERTMLMRQMADLAEKAGASEEASHCRYQADEAEKRLQPIRALLHESEFFNLASDA